MSLLVLAYPEFSREDLSWIQSIRKIHDQNYYLTGPHVTMVFETDDIPEDKFISHVEQVIHGQCKIDILLRSATMNYGQITKSWFAFLTPSMGNGTLYHLHYKLYTGILADERQWKIPFIPHITIGHFDDLEPCKELIDQLNDERFNIPGMISRIDIVRYEEDISTIKTIDLLDK